ncbi:proton-dependent oligopeptide transport family protein [Hibiscus syriacus]|uniref:Proton-dependent oligopeptide transport family protein n=1 Tax=Hibiscus syriacus TaxID=106335 RepID=A0A6A3BU70_HIBSY|nr:protein OCTOPUS-like [Hibiscus syriacus]KAE8719441.1 proton-dependent oligopeptide transport family protein [Hibiscus syriacus]
MNPNLDPPLPLPLPPPASTPCARHPQERFTVFCTSCLYERLTLLDPSSSSSSRKPPLVAATSTTTAALKSIFKPSGGSASSELRRTKSFSASKSDGLPGCFEPQRKSWSLFSQDYERNPHKKTAAGNLGSSSSVVQGPVFETNEEDQTERETNHENDIEFIEERRPDLGVDTGSIIEEKVEEIEVKSMKDHIDHDSQTKKKSTGSIWSAASVFNKKLQQWRQKQKLKKMKNGGGSVRLPMGNSLGRRSCDIDPRLSFDDPRYSVDEPRTSWDGYLIGRTTFPRIPAMVSLMEDAPVHRVIRSDTQIPVEDPLAMDTINGESLPGGSAQTRDYYSDSRRRKSLDRSRSIRQTAAAVVAEMDDVKSISTAKVSPALNDCRDWNSNSNSESLGMSFTDNASMIGNGERKGSSKKSRKWSKAWNIFGFIHRSGNKDHEDEEDKYSRASAVERSYSYSESWSELRGGFNPKLARSNSCVSWRSSRDFGGARKNSVESNGRLSLDWTPMSGRGGSRRCGSGKSKVNHAHAISRLY